MFDTKAVAKKAQDEIRKEREEAATREIKAVLKKIDQAKAVVRNLEREYEVLLAEIGERV